MNDPKTAWDILKRIRDYDRQQDIERRLHQAGGWRAFFDTSSHQWTALSMDNKIIFLREIMEATHAPLPEIIHAYQMDYRPDRPDIAARPFQAVMLLLDHSIKSGRVVVPD